MKSLPLLAAVALSVSLSLAGCSTSNAHPPILGDCTGAQCGGNVVVDSGTKPPPVDGGPGDAALGADSGSDGSALVDGG